MSRFNVAIETLEVREYKAYNPLEEKKTYSGEMKVLASVNIDARQKSIAVLIKAEVYVKGSGTAGLMPIGYIETAIVFSAKDEWKRIKVGKKQSDIAIDKGLEDFLIDIAYNTTRGLLYERGRNDLIGRMILPLIDPADIRSERKAQG